MEMAKLRGRVSASDQRMPLVEGMIVYEDDVFSFAGESTNQVIRGVVVIKGKVAHIRKTEEEGQGRARRGVIDDVYVDAEPRLAKGKINSCHANRLRRTDAKVALHFSCSVNDGPSASIAKISVVLS